MQRRALPSIDEVLQAGSGTVVVLDGLVDHTNVGAAFRSAAAFGVAAVLVTDTTADPLYRRSVRVSMGTVFQVPWTRVASVLDLTARPELELVALTPQSDAPSLLEVLPQVGRAALVVGSEGPGLDSQTLAACHHRCRIPMQGGVDSLNVAAAVAVTCFAAQQTQGPRPA
jgi:tRNA G18 (ribose-2'-O)-methylase SpoU